jgi:hypothetical protein
MSTTFCSPEPEVNSPARGPWTIVQNHELLRLRDREGKQWAEVASIMRRTQSSCQQHYHLLHQAQEGAMVDWTAPLDAYIIESKRRGLSLPQIAQEMGLRTYAVQGRWNTLLRERKVPDDVVLVCRRKEEVVWSQEEDEAILKLWLKGCDDDSIVRQVNFKNKSKDDVRQRRTRLVNDHTPLYLKMLGLDKEKQAVKNGLEKPLGKKKYSWL